MVVYVIRTTLNYHVLIAADLNSYNVSVSASVNLTKSTSKMTPASTSGPSLGSLIDGPMFIDHDGFDIYPPPYSTPHAYGFEFRAAWEPMQGATAILLPRNKSYVTGVPYYFAGVEYADNNGGLSLVEGVYQNSNNLHNWTLNLAAALTSNLGEVAPVEDDYFCKYYEGTATRSETFFKIRWGKSISSLSSSRS